jgi:heptosyltransferase-2
MKREGGYDVVLDLHGNPRSWYVSRSGLASATGRAGKNRLKRFLLINAGIDLYGPEPQPMAVRYFSAMNGIFEEPIEPDDAGAEIFITDTDRLEAEEALGEMEPYIIVAPSAYWPTKRWLPDRFALAGEILSERIGARVVLVGSGQDRQLAESVAQLSSNNPINLTGKLSIKGTAAVIAKAKAFLGNDTGLMHIAGALDVPGAVVFGPTTRHLGFFPYKSPVAVVEKNDIDCRPCTRQGQNKCPKGHFRCMTEVTVDNIVSAVFERITV